MGVDASVIHGRIGIGYSGQICIARISIGPLTGACGSMASDLSFMRLSNAALFVIFNGCMIRFNKIFPTHARYPGNYFTELGPILQSD